MTGVKSHKCCTSGRQPTDGLMDSYSPSYGHKNTAVLPRTQDFLFAFTGIPENVQVGLDFSINSFLHERRISVNSKIKMLFNH